MKFNLTTKDEGSTRTFLLEGHFDEHAVLPPVTAGSFQKIVVDFGKINSINSVGVRSWIKWAMELGKVGPVSYVNCPKVIVDQMNMVAALAKSGTIDSFFTPYYCENCNTSHQVLFVRSKDYQNGSLNPPKTRPCPKCQSTSEMDVIEKNYFKFLSLPPQKV